ncbi:MAG: AI-2E family transporter [Cellulosilyticaceae bacterium]
MKIEKNSKYLTIAIYTVGTVLTIIVLASIFLQLKNIGGILAQWIFLIMNLLKPLIFGIIIAYLFDPLVSFYMRCIIKKIKHKQSLSKKIRTFSTFFAFVTFIAIFIIFMVIIWINIKNVIDVLQYTKISDTLEAYFKYLKMMIENVDVVANRLPFFKGELDIDNYVYTMLNKFMVIIGDKTEMLLRGIGHNLVSIGLGFIISFYMLQDKEALLIIWRRIIQLLIPRRMQNEVFDIWKDVDYVFSGYIRGQIIDAIIMAMLISIALTAIKLDFAIIIGIISGIVNLIPYFGPIVGVLLAGMVGLIGDTPQKAIYAVLIIMILQQIDGMIIVPHIMGETVKLHPIVVLLVIIIGGQLFGIAGFLFAVPVVGFIRLLIIRYMGDIFSRKEV